MTNHRAITMKNALGAKEALERRVNILDLRLNGDFVGNPGPTQRERSNMKWALRFITLCINEGVVDDLKEQGFQL